MSLRTPPPTRTGSRASRRQTVTKSEFTAVTDVPPLITITTYHLLQDEERMKKLAATFCEAIFSSPCQATIGRIIDESLKLCGGSQETLSTVLQTKFFAGHTPFYWAIVNKGPKEAGVPPLLEKLFTICSHTSDAAIEEEIVTALLGLEDSDDNLYQSIAPCLGTVHQQLTPSYFDGTGQQPTVKATTPDSFGMRGTAEFCIPLFFDRLILDREVCLTFITMGSLWCLRAVADGFPNPNLHEWTWHFELKEIKSQHKYSSGYQRTVLKVGTSPLSAEMDAGQGRRALLHDIGILAPPRLRNPLLIMSLRCTFPDRTTPVAVLRHTECKRGTVEYDAIHPGHQPTTSSAQPIYG